MADLIRFSLKYFNELFNYIFFKKLGTIYYLNNLISSKGIIQHKIINIIICFF